MSSRGFSILVTLLLALSLSLKAATASGDPSLDPTATLSALRTMLVEAGYDARIRRLSRSPFILVEARSRDCRLLAGDYPVHDTFASVYQDLREDRDRVLFVHRGQIYDSAPKARAMTDFFIWRELRRVGIGSRRAPVVALIVSPGCDARALPWERIAFAEG